MAPRLQLEKAAWRWTETVPPEAVTQEHIEAAYRVGLEPCQRGACRYGRVRPELPAPGLASFPHRPSAVPALLLPPGLCGSGSPPLLDLRGRGPPPVLSVVPRAPQSAFPRYLRSWGGPSPCVSPDTRPWAVWAGTPPWLPSLLLPPALSTPLGLPFHPLSVGFPSSLPAPCFGERWDAASPSCCLHLPLQPPKRGALSLPRVTDGPGAGPAGGTAGETPTVWWASGSTSGWARSTRTASTTSMIPTVSAARRCSLHPAPGRGGGAPLCHTCPSC